MRIPSDSQEDDPASCLFIVMVQEVNVRRGKVLEHHEMFQMKEMDGILKRFQSVRETFIRVQRLIWEKSLFPSRFPTCSLFLCSSCNYKTRDLSFCLQCGRVFCGRHFGEHACQAGGFGVDIATKQLFIFDPELGRRFVFSSRIDSLIIWSKLAEIRGLPHNMDPEGKNVMPIVRPPMPLQNLGNTCWLNSVLQCWVVNPVLQNWFLSGIVNVPKEPDCPAAAVHLHLNRLFRAQSDVVPFSLRDFVYAIWTLCPKFATPEQCDSHEFCIDLRTELNAYYQLAFDNSMFGSIFNWQFKEIESCDSCDEAHAYEPTVADLILDATNANTLDDAIAQSLIGTSPKRCHACGGECSTRRYFSTLPLTLTIVRNRGTDKPGAMKLEEEISLDQFVDEDKQAELGPAKYVLIGMVVRPGAGETGHYWANVKNWNQWFRCNDDKITEVNVEEVLRDDACLLFYTRKGIIKTQ